MQMLQSVDTWVIGRRYGAGVIFICDSLIANGFLYLKYCKEGVCKPSKLKFYDHFLISLEYCKFTLVNATGDKNNSAINSYK
jgi:hypothetical protein